MALSPRGAPVAWTRNRIPASALGVPRFPVLIDTAKNSAICVARTVGVLSAMTHEQL